MAFAAIASAALLQCCKGVPTRRRRAGIRSNGDIVDALAGFDLVVGADGVNSRVRATHEATFAADRMADNKFVVRTTKPFECLTLRFATTRTAPSSRITMLRTERSTFIVECTRRLEACRLDAMDDAASRAYLRDPVRA